MAGFEPSVDAVEVKSVVADSPSDGTFLRCSSLLISLAFNTQVHDVVPTNGTVVNDNI